MRRKLLAAAICALLSMLGLVVLSGPAQADPLRNHAGSRFIGYALGLEAQGSDAMYRTVGAREFNIVTAENAMKWESTEPNPNQFTFGGADQVVAAAQANNQQIHGHTLVWHSQTPGWVQGLSGTAMLNAMNNHITTVVNRYENSVRSWDVVNEALNEDGSLRQSFWLNNSGVGEQYIDRAFQAANAADPDAELCINDFNTDGMGAKSNGMFALVQRLLQRGVPIDCVGFQGHLAIQFSFPSQVQANFQRFANLGLNVKITELDVRMPNPEDATKRNTQATYFRQMVQACLGVGARCNQITFWGFTDKFSWVPGTFPNECCALLYDNNYNPKPAYTAVHDALGPGGGGDTTPPTTPGTPTVSGVTSNSASLSWTASTDTGGSGLAGYNVYRRQGTTDTLLTQTTTNSAALTNLTPATQYTVVVRARDGAGNLSNPSGTATFTTQEGGGGTGPCQVAYSANNWGTGSDGFTANLTITNTGTAAVNGWTLAFSFASGQRVSQGWNATWTQAAGSANVTATPVDWNRTINPNTSVGIGFNGTHTGSNPEPTAFTLNGAACTVV
ncbi:MAG TPA: endo-1,4-beta-xylanase [Actinophytocola sp.]|uniref:endo-1,4-beta-xylanase n=1 Tax=Actinophytocola sp. TaxID=1872138 RepID=UPI002DDD4E8F|nr:endo-1,4-beta-xylanase [Actinophytocola sp.]HEV2780156.1 endo-1,4-beta-xylanase [Actinophytocola sp.]